MLRFCSRPLDWNAHDHDDRARLRQQHGDGHDSVSVSDRSVVDGEEPGVEHIWATTTAMDRSLRVMGQALSRLGLAQNALSQTQPCPAIGGVVSVGGASRVWGDIDCSGAITSRDGQALLRNVLGQNALSQTQPCPAIGDTAAVVGAAFALRRWW